MKKTLSLILALVLTFALASTAFAADDNGMATDDSGVYVSGEKTFTITNKEGADALVSADDNTWKIGVEAELDDTAAKEENAAANYYVVVTWNVTSELVYTLNETAYAWHVYSDEEGTTEATTGEAKSAGYKLDYSDGEWTGTATIDVTITNWSNREVTYTLGFEAATTETNEKVYENIVFSADAVKVTEGEGTLAAASDGTANENGLYTAAPYAEAKVSIDASVEGSIEGSIKETDALIGTVTVTLNQIVETTNETPAEDTTT